MFVVERRGQRRVSWGTSSEENGPAVPPPRLMKLGLSCQNHPQSIVPHLNPAMKMPTLDHAIRPLSEPHLFNSGSRTLCRNQQNRPRSVLSHPNLGTKMLAMDRQGPPRSAFRADEEFVGDAGSQATEDRPAKGCRCCTVRGVAAWVPSLKIALVCLPVPRKSLPRLATLVCSDVCNQ